MQELRPVVTSIYLCHLPFQTQLTNTRLDLHLEVIHSYFWLHTKKSLNSYKIDTSFIGSKLVASDWKCQKEIACVDCHWRLVDWRHLCFNQPDLSFTSTLMLMVVIYLIGLFSRTQSNIEFYRGILTLSKKFFSNLPRYVSVPLWRIADLSAVFSSLFMKEWSNDVTKW